MRTKRNILFSVLISLFLSSFVISSQLNASFVAFADSANVKENSTSASETVYVTVSKSIETNLTFTEAFQENVSRSFQGGGTQVLQFSSASFTRHLMCRGYNLSYYPIEPTTIFRPSDTEAVCLTTVSLGIDDTVDFRWYYRNDSSRTWVFCYNWSYLALYYDGEHTIESHLNIRGYWPGTYYPRAYKVEVYYMNSSFLFREFFEVTNGGLNSPRTCEDIDANGQPVNMKSRYTIGADTKVYHYLRFDNIAYFNEETECCHNFTTVWIQPGGGTYKTHSGSFPDYKDPNANGNVTWNYWKYAYVSDDYIFIDSGTLVGNWTVEVYLDTYYFNSTWLSYGPVAKTPFIIGNETVADWTFMVYLDADNTLERPGVDVFKKMASVGSSRNVNIVAQMDRNPGYNITYGFDDRYENWTDCYRFNVTKDMDPTPGNATAYLGEVNMGDPATLKDFVNWTINNYPANYYCLVLWNHGTGCMGVCFDMENANDSISLPELNQALSELPAIMDVVFNDACSMNMVEVAYQIKDYANVLVGPQGLGYAPGPYDKYLLDLNSNSSVSPREFAAQIVSEYMLWCENPMIQSATMSAIDLTRIADLKAAIEDFSIKLEEKETPFHSQISMARSQTEGYEGPISNYTGYYIDLYHFVQLASQSVPNEELQSAAAHVMTALSIGNTIIKEADKNFTNSHGLSIFFPDEKGKYDSFKILYEKTDLTIDTSWDEFLKYHLSGCLLTIQTPYSKIEVRVNEESYKTDSNGRIPVFVLPGSYTLNVTTLISIGSDSRGIFDRWNDNITSNPRTIIVSEDLNIEAEYEIQHRLIINTNFGTTNPSIGEHWCIAGSTQQISAFAPTTIDGERYVWLEWTGTGTGSYSGLDRLTNITMNGPINETAAWRHEYALTVTSLYGSPTPTSGWFEAGAFINGSVTSPASGSAGIRYVYTEWTGTGSVPVSGTFTIVNFTIVEPSTIIWHWKTQYLLTLRTYPAGLSPPPSTSPPGSWYDNGTLVNCTAQQISGYVFEHWTANEVTSWDIGVNPITITMEGPYEAIAHYVHTLGWWEILVRPENMQVILGLLGTILTVALIGITWFRGRKRRGIVKTFLDEIDGVYSTFKDNPRKCEEELYKLRNTILQGLTDGRITEENYGILDSRIDKYMEELHKTNTRT